MVTELSFSLQTPNRAADPLAISPRPSQDHSWCLGLPSECQLLPQLRSNPKAYKYTYLAMCFDIFLLSQLQVAVDDVIPSFVLGHFVVSEFVTLLSAL